MGDLLRPYEHVQNLDISKNEVYDLQTICCFPYLLTLNANTNAVQSISFFENSPDTLQFLQVSPTPSPAF